MNTNIIQSTQIDLIHQILEVQDINVLNKIKALLRLNKGEDAGCAVKTADEIIADWDEACESIKKARERKLKGRPLEEVLNEL